VKVPTLARTGWSPQPGRPDPIAILAAQATTRLPELLPLRYERMRASPFAFLRGSAAVMAADLATLPGPGPLVQLCGDAHLANFGAYASPEGNPVFDANDFDETLAGPFDWDLRRLATSLVVSGREQSLSAKECRALASRAARHYRKHLQRLAGLTPLEAWHSTIDLRAAIAAIDHHKLRRRLEKRLRAALDSSLEHYDLVTSDGAGPKIANHGNTRHLPTHAATIRAAFSAYPETLQPQFADLLVRYRLVDCAFKVVGIGSVGTFCAIGLFISADGAPLLLQLKEAQTSCLAGPTGAPPRTQQGERVVTGQRRLQAQSDIFLGWTTTPIDGRDFYVRRLKDSRLARIGDAIEADLLPFTAALCGRTLARAHGRAGDAARLSAAIAPADDSHAFDEAIADFACAYADQTAMDHAAFCRALDDGTLISPTGKN
jgi:uncharacterized protein (DUF2252 family)